MRTSFRMEDQHISMIRGDTLSFGIELIDKEQKTFTKAPKEIYFSCKSNKNDNYVFQKSIGKGITKTSTGNYQVRVAPTDTKNLEAGKYFYDLQVCVGNDIFTVMHGILEIEQDVTI